MFLAIVCGFLVSLACILPLGLWALRHQDADLSLAILISLAAMTILSLAIGFHLSDLRGALGGFLGMAPFAGLGLNDLRRGRSGAAS